MVKRKRTLLKSCCVQEMEDQSADRKFGLRQAKRAKSFHVYGNEGDGKKKKIKANGVTKENGIWFVTCEKKAGIMDIEKLKRGEKCIECDGLWFTPPAFEEFAGRGACKKWKVSICHEGRPLTHSFAKGILSTTGYVRRGTEPIRKIKVPSRKKEGKPAKIVCNFQGLRSSKYMSSTSVTQKNISSGGFIPTKRAEIKPTEDPVGRSVKGDDKHSDSNPGFLKADQENKDRSDEGNNGHTINSGDAENGKQDEDPNQSKTDDGGVLAAADPPKDQGATKGRHQDVAVAKAEKQEVKRLKTKVVIRRLSRRACKAITHQKDSWCEPLEESAHSEETEDNTAVSEALREENVKELDNSNENPGISSVQLVDSDQTGLFAAPQNLLLQYVHKKETNEAKPQLGEAELEMSGTGIQVSDCIHAPEMVEDLASGVLGHSNMDAMDLDQLKREKIKMQLKVLKLQEEYYMLMLHDLKK